MFTCQGDMLERIYLLRYQETIMMVLLYFIIRLMQNYRNYRFCENSSNNNVLKMEKMEFQ